MKMEQHVPKHRHIKFRCRGITPPPPLSLYIYESITTGRQLSDQSSLHKHPNKSVCGYKITEANIHHSHTPTLQFREQNSSHLKIQKTGTAGSVLWGKAKADNLYVCGTELARLYPNFNYVLTFEMTSKSYEERQHCTGNSEVSGHKLSVVPVFIPTPELITVLMYG
jgi:hypothetical protein